MLESITYIAGIFLGAMLFVLFAVILIYGIFTVVELIADDIRDLTRNKNYEDDDE